MSTKKLERVLQLVINENTDAAKKLLHDVFVEQSRKLYSDIVTESDFSGAISDFDDADFDFETADEFEIGDEEMDLSGYHEFDESSDMVDELEAGDEYIDELSDEVDTEEFFGESDELEFDDEELDTAEQDVVADLEVEDESESESDNVETSFNDIEDALASLRAEFEAMIGSDDDEQDEDDFSDTDVDEDEFEDDGYSDDLEESAKLSAVAAPSNKEGAASSKSVVANIRDKKAEPVKNSTKVEDGAKAQKPTEMKVKGPQDHGAKYQKVNAPK